MQMLSNLSVVWRALQRALCSVCASWCGQAKCVHATG